VTYGSYQELAGLDRVYDLVETCVDQVNRDLAAEAHLRGSQIRRFLILHKELDADDGELTRTRKVRRGFIAERFAPLIDALYSGAAIAQIDSVVTFEDGRTGRLAAALKIRDAAPADPPAGAAARAPSAA
jgi:long-chain acyl-CoA synthetase